MGTVAVAAGAAPVKMQKEIDEVRLADLAHLEVYVCFGGPLGAHLQQEVREKIRRDEFVKVFSLLSLDFFFLDRRKRDKSKKEEEEKRQYWMI